MQWSSSERAFIEEHTAGDRHVGFTGQAMHVICNSDAAKDPNRERLAAYVGIVTSQSCG